MEIIIGAVVGIAGLLAVAFIVALIWVRTRMSEQ